MSTAMEQVPLDVQDDSSPVDQIEDVAENKIDFDQIKAYVATKITDMRINGDLIDMLEGNLFKYVEDLLRAQLSAQSFEQAKHRISPINLLKKINDKLSTIYNPGPQRNLENGNSKDKEMLDWYIKNSNINRAMKTACENYSLCKTSLVQPIMHDEKLLVRIIQNNIFAVMSLDQCNPLEPTHVIIITPSKVDPTTYEYLVYTETQVIKFKSDGSVDRDFMNSIDNPFGVNIYNEVPFIYINGSQRNIMPNADIDLKTMVCLLPLLLSDLNYAVMFQCFSIVYGINVDDEGLKRSPNAFWALKSDKTTDAKPELGVIKPQVDIDQVLALVQSELSLFLNSRGIKPGSIGALKKDTFASGLSKMVDEIDTVELRKDMVTEFTEAEERFWNYIINVAHPIWIKTGEVPFAVPFTKEATVKIVFAEQLPLVNRGQIVADLNLEVTSGFTTKRRAIQALNPDFSEDDLNKLMDELAKEPKPNVNQVAKSGSQNTLGSVAGSATDLGGSVY